MRIADAAAQVGVPTHRLRHYEQVGLLIPGRSPSGYRDYRPADVDTARRICALLDSGFTAKDVALMLPCMDPEPDEDLRCCQVTRTRLTERLKVIAERRAQLQHTERALTQWLATPDAAPHRAVAIPH